MKARELNDWLRALHAVPEPSVDRVVAGDPENEVRGLAVMWMPTWNALRDAATRGANLVVAHEPTYFAHLDFDGYEETFAKVNPKARAALDRTRDAKRRWIEEQGMTVIRCHDVLDLMPGGIVDSFAAALGFAPKDYVCEVDYFRVIRIEPRLTALALAQRLATACRRIEQPGVAFYGDPEREVSALGLGTGYACEPWRFVELGAEMAVTIDDRIKTWTEAEWADDSGYPLAVIHHGTSEEWGVRRLAEILREKFPAVPVHLIPQGFTARWVTSE